jgi:tRNA pseudouridine55 synthase
MQRGIDGILLVDKGPGQSSYDVLRGMKSGWPGLRKIKLGHAGTLDPFATGLLIVLLGQGTKLSGFLMALGKTYRATLRLGIETDTMDLTGEVVSRREVPELTVEAIRKAAERFSGPILQEPPSYSALKVGGRRAYALARKGVAVHLKPRLVQVERIEVLSVKLPEVVMEVSCSKGTYVRRLASDIGAQLGPGAHLFALRRMAIGSFRAEDGIKVEAGGEAWTEALLAERVIRLSDALPHLPEVVLDGRLAGRVRQGRPVPDEAIRGMPLGGLPEGSHVKLVDGQGLVAVARIATGAETGGPTIEIERVFPLSNAH